MTAKIKLHPSLTSLFQTSIALHCNIVVVAVVVVLMYLCNSSKMFNESNFHHLLTGLRICGSVDKRE